EPRTFQSVRRNESWRMCQCSTAPTPSQKYKGWYEPGRAAMEKRRINRDQDDGPIVKSLAALRSQENICQRCPIYKDATQAVAGEGPKSASMMLVGEQPGDQEDRAGHPFVGPAGRLLD